MSILALPLSGLSPSIATIPSAMTKWGALWRRYQECFRGFRSSEGHFSASHRAARDNEEQIFHAEREPGPLMHFTSVIDTMKSDARTVRGSHKWQTPE